MKRIKKKDKIYIFEPLKLQNELLVSYLEKNTGMDCEYWRKQKITSIPDRKDVRSSLILLDCYDNDMNSFWIKLDLSFCSTRHKCYVALINVKGKRTLIEVSGKVIRNGGGGMAVCFAEDCKISPIAGTATED
jgi:hypothetical protein